VPGHRLPHGVFGRVHKPRHLEVEDVEHLAAFVEVIHLAILGQTAGDLRPRNARQIAQGVLVLMAIEPTPDRSALAGPFRTLRGDSRPRQVLDEGFLPIGVGLCLAPGRHLARLHAIVHRDPDDQVGGIARVKLQAGQVELSFPAHVVVAARAGIADEGVVGRGWLDCTGRPAAEQDQHREPEESEAGPTSAIPKRSVAYHRSFLIEWRWRTRAGRKPA
jgi:hypothetical protein